MPEDPYEQLQTARAAVRTLRDEQTALAARVAELARLGDHDALVEASQRLEALPAALHAAELDLARRDSEAARATLAAAEQSLTRERAALRDAEAGPEEADGGARSRLGGDEQWVRDCRLAVERAERRARDLQETAPAQPGEADEPRHESFAKRVAEARDAITTARSAQAQADLDLVEATELAKVTLDGLRAARAGSDWRALDTASEARARAAAAVGPAWEALRCANLRVARAEYELDRIVLERLGAQA